MGRPWWYDSYWEKNRLAKRRARLPRRRFVVWLVLFIVSTFIGLARNGFHVAAATWILGSVEFICGALSAAVIVRAILSWVMVGGYSIMVKLLDDATEPILWPLRRIIPLIGRFDLAPVVAIVILGLIPYLVSLVLSPLT